MIDKMMNFSMETIMIAHSTFASATIFVCIYILLILTKFIGANILQVMNAPFIEAFNISNICGGYLRFIP
jgi:hypothetical protein